MIADAAPMLLILVLIGIWFAGMGAWSFKNKKTLIHGGRPINKAENPFLFWFMIIVFFGSAAFSICFAVYLLFK
jgi:hypothetical protein